MTLNQNSYDPNLIQERFTVLEHRLKGFGIYPDSLLTLDQFVDILSKLNNNEKPNRGVLLRIFEATPKDENNNFTLSQFAQAYVNTLVLLHQQKQDAQNKLKNLEDHQKEAKKTLSEVKLDETLTQNGLRPDSCVHIEVFEAKGLDLKKDELIYVRLNCQNVTMNTQTVCGGDEIKWNEKFSFPIKSGLEKLNIILLTKSTFAPRILGNLQIPVAKFKDQQVYNQWFSLSQNNTFSVYSKIRLGFQWIYSKVTYLTDTIRKLGEHIKMQVEDAEDLSKEIQCMNSLLPDDLENNFINEDAKQSINSSVSTIKFDNYLTTKEVASNVHNPDMNNLFQSPPNKRLTASPSSIGAKTMPNVNAKHKKNASETERITTATDIITGKAIRFETNDDSYEQQTLHEQVGTTYMSTQTGPIPTKSSIHQYRSYPASGYVSPQNYNSMPTQPVFTVDENIENYKEKLEASNQENRKLKKIIEEMKKERQKSYQNSEKVRELTEQIGEYETKVHLLIDELDRVSKTIKEKNKEIDTLRIQANEANQSQESMLQLQNRLKDLITENGRLNELLVNNSNYTNMWREKAQKSEDAELKIQEELTQVRQEAQNLQNAYLDKMNEIERLKLKIASSQEPVQPLSNYNSSSYNTQEQPINQVIIKQTETYSNYTSGASKQFPHYQSNNPFRSPTS